MAWQKVFTPGYVRELKDSIDIEAYKADIFDVKTEKVKYLIGVPVAESLASKMNPKDDFASAVALYEAFPKLSLLDASQMYLWAYLAHTDLFQYMKKRWPAIDSGVDYIVDHWFTDKIRGFLSGLWWTVKLTVDEKAPADHKYDLTMAAFLNQTFRTRTFVNSAIGKSEGAREGILRFVANNWSLFETKSEARLDFVKTFFSRLGATRELSYFDKDFFYSELEKRRGAIEKVNTRNDARHNKQIWIF